MRNLIALHRRIYKKEQKRLIRDVNALSDVLNVAREVGIPDERIKEIAGTIPQDKNFFRLYRQTVQNEINGITEIIQTEPEILVEPESVKSEPENLVEPES